MEKIIKRAGEISTNDADIYAICQNQVNIVNFNDIKSMLSIDELFVGGMDSCIIFYCVDSATSGHWTTLFLLSFNFVYLARRQRKTASKRS